MNKEILNEINSSLAATFNGRFKGIVLFGSEATGCSFADSDIDILVLLEGPIELGNDLEKIIQSTYHLQTRIFRQMHFIPADYRD